MSDPVLLPLAESIADGNPIDWHAVAKNAGAEEQGVIRQLRILAKLAVLHRSLPEAGETHGAIGRPSHSATAIGNWAHLALVARLGSGSFGEVYRAWDRRLEREVALKILHTDTPAADLESSRIANEGRLLARVRHPNVITVHGVEVHEGRIGLCMELIRGTTIEESLLRRGPFSAREAALIGIDVCRALAAIHGAGLIHRDVKAQNVMREDGGRIVLMDLGTGRESDRDADALRSDLAGTPLYLAPELFDGGPASANTDLYSVGILLYHLVTAAFPIRARHIDDLRAGHAARAGIRLRDARADLPAVFVRIVDRAIAADPEARYPSAGALEADLIHALDADPTLGTAPAAAAPAPAAARVWTWRHAALVAAVAVAASVVAVVGWRSMRMRPAASVASAAIRAIAVLPLVNLSGDPAQEYFADGMTDELIGTLGRLPGIQVISRTSAMQFKGSKKPLTEIARALNVDAVLEGSVLIVGDGGSSETGGGQRVRINAGLIQAGTQTQLWNRTFERVVADVLTLQSEVAKAVADGIDLRLSSQQEGAFANTAASRVQQFGAFDLYLRGRYYWNLRTAEGLKRSVQYFQEAIDRDPTYATAYAGLADAYYLFAQYGVIPREDALQRANAAASKALALDASLAEAHAALAAIHDERLEFEAAGAAFRRAVQLKPGYAAAHHWYANYLSQLGRFPEAMAEIDRALLLDPLSIGVSGGRGAILLVARRYDEAIAQLQETLKMEPTFSPAHMVLAEAYAHKGDYARALAAINTAVTLERGGGAGLRADLGYILAVAGRRREALGVVAEIRLSYGRNEEGAAGALAVVFAGLGDKTNVFQWLERARAVRDPLLHDLKTDPRFDKVRDDARFGKLLANIGFAQ
jgi:TolB-like protein/Flp pilus assembly protein TadD